MLRINPTKIEENKLKEAINLKIKNVLKCNSLRPNQQAHEIWAEGKFRSDDLNYVGSIPTKQSVNVFGS